MLLVLFGATFSPTVAYFSDSEFSKFNFFVASLLDGEIIGDGFDAPLCEVGNMTDVEFVFENKGALSFTYDVFVPDLPEEMRDFCNLFNFTAYRNGDVAFVGVVEDFRVEGLELDSNVSDTWMLSVEFPSGTSGWAIDAKQCDFETVFLARQQGFVEDEAFSDEERLAHSLVGHAPVPDDIVIEIENEADIENNIENEANTGGNVIPASEEDSSVETGDATASTTVTNNVNNTEIVVESSCGVCGTSTVTIEGESNVVEVIQEEGVRSGERERRSSLRRIDQTDEEQQEEVQNEEVVIDEQEDI